MNTQVPRGFEVLVKKASVDPAFKTMLLERRAEAADTIGLRLEPAEATMLAATPREQLEAIIASADVPQAHRRAFLGQAAAAMLAVLGVVSSGRSDDPSKSEGLRAVGRTNGSGMFGNRPDEPAKPQPPEKDKKTSEKEKALEKNVVALIAKLFKKPAKDLKGTTSLVDDLYATASQLGLLRRQLEKQFKLTVPVKDFEKLSTVGDVVAYVKDAIRRRDAKDKPKPEPTPGPTRGVQPDRPPAVGGIRPQ